MKKLSQNEAPRTYSSQRGSLRAVRGIFSPFFGGAKSSDLRPPKSTMVGEGRSPLSGAKEDKKNGFVALVIAVLVLVTMLSLAASMTILILNENKSSQNNLKALQSYYLAETGIEDSLYRIIKGKHYEATNIINLSGGIVNISVTDNGEEKIINSRGENNQAVRKVKTVLSTETTTIAFHYGAQVDKGGIAMANNAKVIGNIYSNGSIVGDGLTSEITGDAWVAGTVAATADQEWIVQNADFPFGIKSGTVYYLDTAQSFVPSVSKVINQVSLYLKKVGSPPDQTVRILTDNSGQPSNTSLGSGSLKASLVTSNYSWVSVSFDPPINLTSGTSYWIMIDVSRDDNNYWILGKDLTDGYASGSGKYSRDWSVANPVWNSVGGDLDFKTWMGGETPTFIDNVSVGTDVHANTITTCLIGRDAYYQIIDSQTTVSGSACSESNPHCHPNSPDPATKEMPISYGQIQEWEKAACCDSGSGCQTECVHTGNYSPAAGSSLGPIKIEGDLNFPGNSTDNPVIITGPVWVTGKITASNNAGIKLKPGLTAGYAIIADNPTNQASGGKIELSNNVVTTDSSNGGRLLFISTNTSTDSASPAINLYNNVNKDNPQSIIFSLQGLIKVENNAKFKEITGYAIRMENNSEIVYEEGLINSNFSSGPAGGWEIESWEEVE